MYSDCVYVDNFFLDYVHFKGRRRENVRMNLLTDIAVLLVIRPLLENGFIKFYTPEAHACINCYYAALGVDTRRRIDQGYKQLADDYLTNSTVTLLRYTKRVWELQYDGPEEYFDHATILSSVVRATNTKVHQILGSKSQVLERLRKDGSVQLSQTVKRQLGLHSRFAREIADSVTFGILLSRILRTSFLTDQLMDISFLRSVSSNPQIDQRNLIALKHLTSIVPFVGEVSISDLIKIRKREGEAFIQYRQALNEAIDEVKSGSPNFGEKEARALYSDVIAPRLATLDRSVNLAKRDLLKKASTSIVAVAGAISFGLYTGFIPKELAEMARGLGFTKIAADVFEKLLTLGNAQDAIKNQNLYFLWKAKKLAK